VLGLEETVTPRFALAIPTCADFRPERAESLEKLKGALGNRPEFYREFREKAPNWVWSRAMWAWAAEMGAAGATHFLQIQDDVRPSPKFWPSLRAMVEANPGRVIALQSQHPILRNLAAVGRRWARSRAWLVGCQYVFPLAGPDSLQVFMAWLAENEGLLTKHQREHEDVTISTWLASTGRDCWYPIPAIADVDLTIPSAYDGVDGHMDDHRRPVVTWHGYSEAELSTINYWTPPAFVELVPGPGLGICTLCGVNQGYRRTSTWAAICKTCVKHLACEAVDRA
jgi:hypothetical protein